MQLDCIRVRGVALCAIMLTFLLLHSTAAAAAVEWTAPAKPVSNGEECSSGTVSTEQIKSWSLSTDQAVELDDTVWACWLVAHWDSLLENRIEVGSREDALVREELAAVRKEFTALDADVVAVREAVSGVKTAVEKGSTGGSTGSEVSVASFGTSAMSTLSAKVVELQEADYRLAYVILGAIAAFVFLAFLWNAFNTGDH